MYYIKMFFPSGWIECVVVQFYPWFKLYFLLFQTRYHTLPYTITKENKIQTKDKLSHKKYVHGYRYHKSLHIIPFYRLTQLLQLKVPSVKPSCAFYNHCEGSQGCCCCWRNNATCKDSLPLEFYNEICMCRSIINIDIKILQSNLSLSRHLFKSDTSLRWTPGAGPCHFLVILL